ncbi:zinc finger CCHC domain-containing protein 7 isoform X4 [Mirounga angustirostris]|uniref:zinc finger CCHC domain-containing protein 7 isoform X4 n=1 Tax=Mirounga angustirostris TaxID=9716 RepID=UPI00313E38A7
MMFGGYETIEAYEDELYREESSSELSVDSEVEFQLYSQVHYAQDLDNIIREEEHEEKNSGNSESSSSKPNQKNLIILSDSEVIQLSDGSEVITLSDEDSIYRCKRKNFRVQAKEKTRGPPASLHSNKLTDKKCKGNIEKPKPEEIPGTIREVMIIEVSSSEEEESTISESDNVENWMLLGCEVDDKDDDILLNLVGCENSVNEGEDGVSWFISDRDAEAQIVNNRSSGRWTHRYYSANKNVTCRNCDKCGHLSKNCPFPQACPEIWRQYHLTTKPGPPKKPKTPSGQSALVYCYNCGQEGHYGHECTERRMFNQTFPTSPFIYYYDDKYEIREREQRIKRKVKELQRNGDFPRQFKRPHMEAADKRPQHNRRKSHASCRNNRWPQEKKEPQKEASRSNKEREKHRKADRCREVDEDFPRGPKLHSSGPFKTQKAPKSFHHSSHSHKPREDKLPREGKRSKHKKKESYLEADGNDNLFLIKQRKKKSKL